MSKAEKTPIPFTEIKKAADLDKETLALSQAVRDFDQRIHNYIGSVVLHIIAHRNTTRLNTFLSNMKGTGVRNQALHGFIQAFGVVNLVSVTDPETQKKTKSYKLVKNHKMTRKVALGIITSKSWTDYAPEPEAKMMNLGGRVSSLVKMAHEKAKEGLLVVTGDDGKNVRVEDGKVNSQMQAYLKRALAEFEASEKAEAATTDKASAGVLQIEDQRKSKGGAVAGAPAA